MLPPSPKSPQIKGVAPTRSKKEPTAEAPTPARARPPVQPSSSKERPAVGHAATPKSPTIQASGGYSVPADTARPQSPPLPAAGNYAIPVTEAALGGQLMDEEELPSGPLIACDLCSRKFNEKAHAKHVLVCKKVFCDKRKAFNVVEQRLPEGAKPPRAEKKSLEPADSKKKCGWKQKSEAFRAALKEARIVQQYQKEGRSLSELPPPKATDPELDDRVPCPHCGRRFGDVQAQRHIEFCAQQKMKSRPPGAGRGAGRGKR